MVEAYLQRSIEQNTLPNALLFIGEGETIARKLAAQLLQTSQLDHHPDFQTFTPEGKSGLHSIESIRQLIDRVYSAPFQADKKVFLLTRAERMQPAAANALLKTLEEPLLDTYLLLIADDVRSLLPTIRSRCTELPLHTQIAVNPIQFENLSEEFGRIGKEIEETEDPLAQHRRFDELLSSILMWMRDGHARLAGVSEEKLFFPKASAPNKLISLEKLETTIEKARLAHQRNIALRGVLEWLLIALK